MSFLEDMKSETTVGRTENGAMTYTSTLNANLDFYAQAGAMRSRLEDIRGLFAKAFDEHPEVALRNLIHLRNIRLGGLGERSAYLEAFKYLIDGRDKNKQLVNTLMDYMAYVGRWTDLLDIIEYGHKRSIHFVEIHGVEIIGKQLEQDLIHMKEGKAVSLLGKWLASTSSPTGRKRNLGALIAKRLNFTGRSGFAKYRKMIMMLRDYLNVLEVRLASKEYDKIDLTQVPSKALFKYRKALQRHMPEEYECLLQKVESGETTMSAKLMMPHEVIGAYGGRCVRDNDRSLEATWKSLDDVVKGIKDNAIVVADTSASMTGLGGYYHSERTVEPWNVAEGLAIYTAERLEGAFKGHFITFSSNPYLVQLPMAGTLQDKMKEYNRHSIVSSTNIQKVYDLILTTAVRYRTPQSELPSKILIISDMEFNLGAEGIPNHEQAKHKFAEYGYELPSIVYWNVDSRQDNVPARHNEYGVALVSGFSTNILTTVLGGDITTPEAMMMKVLMKPEYDFVQEALA